MISGLAGGTAYALSCPANIKATGEDVLSFENKPEKEGYMEYRVEPDVTPPTKPEGFYGSFEEASGQTFITWNPSSDPPFPDGYHGSGVASYTYRYQLNGGVWTSWQSTTTPGFTIASTTVGEKIGLEIKSVDLAKNESPTVGVTLIAEVSKLTAENIGETAPGEKGEAPLYPEPEEEGSAAVRADAEPVGPTKLAVKPDSEPYKEYLCGSGASPCGKYNGVNASAYAQRWLNANQNVEESYEHRNRAYGYYGGNGGDCTNFVSQALKAGGMEYMRAHGDNNPNGFETPTLYPEETFLKGEGSWWSYYEPLPIAYDYTPTESFVRAHVLYEHMLDTGLGRDLKGHEQVKPGDIVFFDLEHYSLAPSEIDHSELITRLTGTETVVVG
jgi:hypothetical protein